MSARPSVGLSVTLLQGGQNLDDDLVEMKTSFLTCVLSIEIFLYWFNGLCYLCSEVQCHIMENK